MQGTSSWRLRPSAAQSAFRKNERAIPIFASPMLAVFLLAALTAVLLPFVYDIIIRASVPDDDYGPRHEVHIALNVLVTLFCLVIILNTGGDFQHRLKTAMVGVFINYGALMLSIMVARLYYS